MGDIARNVTTQKVVFNRHLSKLLMVCFAAVVVIILTGVYLASSWLDRRGCDWGFRVAGYVITLLIRVFIFLWKRLAYRLCDMEYHRWEKDFFDSWSVKQMLMTSITSFAPFIYVGFFMRFIDRCPPDQQSCFGYLCHQ